ncbi:MAG: MaoC family dehydratase [Acetobacterales bacterium]
MPDSPDVGHKRDGYYFEDLRVGMTSEYSRTVDEADIAQFSQVSGDTNPVHLDEEYAKKSVFGGRVAHGMLSASFISKVLGTQLPGIGCIYMEQNLRFKAPVRLGDTVDTVVEVTELEAEKHRARLHTVCRVGDKVVIDGNALVLVPPRKR